MKKETRNRFAAIGLLALLLPLSARAQADKVVAITGDVSYSGTYAYQGIRNSNSYYKHPTLNIYLYVDNYLGVYGNMWMIGALMTNPTGTEIKYYQWPFSSDPNALTWYNEDNGNTVVAVSITDAASGVAPTVSSLEASLVTTTSGTIGGNVIADGGATTSRGLVYSSSDATPTIGEAGVTQITKGTGIGEFTESIGSLTAGSTYYFQAYGSNTYGTAYGGVKSFTTPTTSQPNKLVSGITSPSGANGVYVWIGNYYGKPAWKHQTSNYWIYYSRFGVAFPSYYYWYIDDELKDEHGSYDYFFWHTDAASCPPSGWTVDYGSGVGNPAISDYPQIEFTSGSAYSPGSPTAGTSNNPVGRFYLDADIAGASMTVVTIAAGGTRSGVTGLKIWSSTDATFNSGSDTQLNGQSDGATVTFSGFSSSISTSGVYYFITADLGASASGSFTLTIASQASLTIGGGAIASGFSNAGLTNGSVSIASIPEMNVQGNGNSISDGDVTPTSTDHTDFGSAAVTGSTVVRTFTIQNTGGGTLNLTGSSPYVSVGGTNASEFSVTTAPSSSISAGGSTTFNVTFDPAGSGTRSATLSIANDDGDENPYNFSIQGTGTPGVVFTNGAAGALNFVQPGVVPPQDNWPLGQFSLTGDATGVTLNSVTVTLSGTYDAGDLAPNPLQLFASNTNSFSGALAIGTSQADPGSGNDVTFSSLGDAVSSGPRFYWVTADVAASATFDHKIHGTVDASGDLGLSGGTLGMSNYGLLNAGEDASLPVGLTSFSARAEGRSVILNWVTESETDNLGFILERSPDGSEWMTIASHETHSGLKGQGSKSGRTEYAFTDSDVEGGKTYGYRLSDESLSGTIQRYAPLSVSVSALPAETEMDAAYPNPFNPNTYIAYRLSEDEAVRITVFDMMGRVVRTLHEGRQSAGSYQVYWNGTDEAGRRVSSGMYLIRMQAGEIFKVQKVLLAR